MHRRTKSRSTFIHFADIERRRRARQLGAKSGPSTAEKCPSIETAQFLDLRDTAVTRLAMSGCTKWEIASITGHDFGSIDQILKHYLVLTRVLADAGIDPLVAWMDQQGIKL